MAKKIQDGNQIVTNVDSNDNLTFSIKSSFIDSTPTANSTNLVTSGGVKSALDTNTTDIAAAVIRIANNETNISNNTDDIETLDGRVSTNTTNISTNTTDIDTLETTVGALSTNVNTNTAKIGTLSNLTTTSKTNLVSAINEINVPSKWVSVGSTAPTDGRRVWFKKSENLLPQNQYVSSTTINGITFTNNGDGTFNLTGTATANTTLQIIPIGKIELEVNQPYYLYSSVPYDGNTFNLTIAMTDNSTTKFIFANNTYTPTTTPTKVRLQFYINNGKSVNATNIKLMLIKGNTAPSKYEPYVDEGIYVDDEEWFRKNLFEDVTSKVSVSVEGGSVSASDVGSINAQKFYHIASHIYIGNIVLTNVTPHYNNDQMQILFKVSGIGTILKCAGSGGNYDRQFASIFDDANNNVYAYIQKGANASTSNFNATYRCIFITQED